jgi:hypothetical protein
MGFVFEQSLGYSSHVQTGMECPRNRRKADDSLTLSAVPQTSRVKEDRHGA